ncbi:MAG: glycosyltransferase family 2 protein [Patescibacteria group bacterium]
MVYVLILIFAITGGLSAFYIFLILKNLSQRSGALKLQSINKIDAPNILLLVPVLNEAKVIKGSLEYFSKFKYPNNKLKIIFITSARESEPAANSANTIMIINKILPKINKLRGRNILEHSHFESTAGIKSDQLNYAVKKYWNENPEFFSRNTYVGVYDVDSMSPLDACMTLAKDAMLNKFPNIYQQPTLYFKNYSRLPFSLDGILARSFSFIQTIYAVTHETLNLMRQSEIIKKYPFIFHKSRYCVGHGLFIKWPYLKKINFFPSPIEDTRLGHMASCLREDIRILPVFDTAEAAEGTTNKIKQASNWFLGLAMCFKDMNTAARIHGTPKFYGYWLTLHRLYRNIIWMLRGPLFAGLIIYLLWQGLFSSALLVTLLFLWIPAAVLIMNFKYIDKLSAGKFYKFSMTDILAVILMPAELFLMSVGPIYGLFKYIFWSIKPSVKFFYKTVR